MDKQIAENEGVFMALLKQEMKELQENQKQIEEMAKDMLGYGMEKYPTGESVFTETKLREQFFHLFLSYAEHLIGKGYRKIPKCAVVLTPAERDEEMRLIRENVIERMEATRKETVEEFAERLKEKFDYDEILCSIVDRIVKEITEGEGIEIYKQGFKEGVEALKIQAKERKFEIITDAGNREDVVFVEDIDEIVKELCG